MRMHETAGSTATRRARVIAVVGCALLGVGVGISAATVGKNIVIPFEEVQFPPLKPLGESTASAFPVWRHPDSGGGSALIKFTKGATDKHLHTFDYQLVVVKGTVTHWAEKIPEAGTTKLGPGSYWFQPRNELHQDTCLEDECIMFMYSFSGGETKREADLKK